MTCSAPGNACSPQPRSTQWARDEAVPSQEEITRIRRLISRVENGLDDLTAAEREQTEQAVAIVRRHRTVTLGMPRLRHPFLQAAVAATGDRAEVHEHVRATLDCDEAVALVAVEPLHSALRHLDLLGCICNAPPAMGVRAYCIAVASLSRNTMGV